MTTQTAETMTVTVRDRASERSEWSVPIVRKITISAFCPVCGERRGEPFGINSCDNDEFYWVQGWRNDCGHVDLYADVVREAESMS